MTASGGGKPHIVIGQHRAGRGLPLAALVLGVLLGHLWLLERAQPVRARPATPALVLRGVQAPVEVQPLKPAAAVLSAQAPKAVATARPRPTPAAPAPAPDDSITTPSVTAAAPVAPQAAASAPPGGELELPVYATRLPPPLHWVYRFSRGSAQGSAELHWQPDGPRYEARFTGVADGAPVFEWSSTGVLDGAGVAPERYLDRRRGRGAQAANFRRELGRISYSGPAVEWPLPAGAQDRLSWMPQLAGIVAAAPQRWQDGREILLFVSGARGDAEVWRFRVAGQETLQGLPGDPVTALKLLREPSQPYGIRAELWLDPARHHMPVRARFTNGAVVWALDLQGE